MRKLSDLYIILQQAFLTFRSSSLCVDLIWIHTAKKVSKSEWDLICQDFATFKPEGKKKGEHWFKNTQERLEFLNHRILTLKNEGL